MAEIRRPQSLIGRELLTSDEVGAWLTVSRRTIHRLVKAGKLKPIYLRPRTVRYLAADIEDYLRGSTNAEAPAQTPEQASSLHSTICGAPDAPAGGDVAERLPGHGTPAGADR